MQRLSSPVLNSVRLSGSGNLTEKLQVSKEGFIQWGEDITLMLEKLFGEAFEFWLGGNLAEKLKTSAPGFAQWGTPVVPTVK